MLMRVFHLVPNLNYGGLQKVVRLLALEQRQSGHSVTIGCWTNTSNHPEAERELEQEGAHVIHLRRANDGGMLSGRMPLLRALKPHLGAKNADILHVHNPFSYYLYGALAARAAGRTKVINTIHATAMFDHPRFGRRGRTLFWTAAMLSHGLVSVCPEVDTFLRRRFPLVGLKLFVVNNGIDMAPFLAVPARKLRSVEFCGFSHDVAGFLGELDIFVLPSDFEALPLSLLEAIASGLR